MSSVVVWSIIVLGGMGLVLGAILAACGRVFAVKLDPRVEEVAAALPGINCGVCGFPGCDAMAEALVEGRANAGRCTPGGPAVVRKVAAILGVAEEEVERRVAVVRCQGGREHARERAVYRGIEDCVAVELIGGGAKACVYGCLGFGSCVSACPFGALRMTEDLLPAVIEERCTGCGKCVEKCPRGIIAMIPLSQRVYLGCVSWDKGKSVREACSMGCIACGLCANPKVTPSGSVEMKGNLPHFPPDWSDYQAAVEKCPAGCFVVR